MQICPEWLTELSGSWGMLRTRLSAQSDSPRRFKGTPLHRLWPGEGRPPLSNIFRGHCSPTLH